LDNFLPLPALRAFAPPSKGGQNPASLSITLSKPHPDRLSDDNRIHNKKTA
jgi:hypothetical protein